MPMPMSTISFHAIAAAALATNRDGIVAQELQTNTIA